MCGCLDEWEAWRRAQGHAPNTLRARVGAVRRAAAHAGVTPCSLTTMQLVGYLDQQMAPWTRHVYVTGLRQWGAWLVRTGRRTDDPAANLPKPRTPRGVPRPVTEPWFEQLLAAAHDPRTRAMIVLAGYAGLRAHEIAQHRGEDIDQDALYVTGKGGVTAMIPTHPAVWEIAQAMPRSGPWFPSTKRVDGHMSPTTVSRMIRGVMLEIGLDATAHRLRHRYGTGVLRGAGGNLRVAQELLRHASPTTTAIYTQVDDAEKRAAVLALA